MYLIVLDSNCVTSDRQYYICKGEYFKNIISIYPKLKDINENDIEEVLLCSFMKNLSQNHIKISKCKKISVTDCEIKITYDSIKTDNVYCGDVMGRIVGHLFAKKLKKNKKDPIPFIMLLEDYQDYLDIKENVVMIKYMSLMERVEYLKNKKEWANIVDLFPNEQEIEKENIWNKVECLKELSFALSKIIEPGYKKIDIREKKKYKDYFIKVINRCIELEPDKYNHKSILAYHYYITFSKEKNHKNNIYEKAETLYKYLIDNSNEKYKELYRYTKLRQYNFDVIRWNCDARSRGLYVNEILKDFEKLINDYVFLSEYNQKSLKNIISVHCLDIVHLI